MNTNKAENIFRRTKQRQKILDVLCSTKSHPTADWIYERVKKEFPKLSLGTVYRNLKTLKEQGKIQELPFGDTFDRFDGNTEPHPHFVCKVCGDVYDLEIDQPSAEKFKVRSSEFEVEDYKITFYGKCNKCKGTSKKHPDARRQQASNRSVHRST